jgi:Domain of unknown function (DUF4169)
MTNVVNLRRARKQKQRSDKEKTAADNRVRFGRTKAERHSTEAQQNLEARRLDGVKLADGPKDNGQS